MRIVSRQLAAMVWVLVALGCKQDAASVVTQNGDPGGDTTPPTWTRPGWDGQSPLESDGVTLLQTGGGSTWDSLTFTFADVEGSTPDKGTGLQGKLLRANNGTLFYSYLKYLGPYLFDTALNRSCDIAVFGGGAAPASQYEAHVAVLPAGALLWSVETVPLQNVPAANNRPFVGGRLGIDGVVNNSGQLVLAMAAGGAGLFTCASSDLVVATRTAANTYSFQVPAADSGAFGTSCNTAMCPGSCGGGPCVCPAPACCNDPNCGAGSDVGIWAAIAFSPSGQLGVAYTDSHNFIDQDGQDKHGLELWEAPSTVTGIRPWSNYGKFAALRFVSDTPVVAYTGYASNGRMWVARRTATVGDGNDWQATQLRTGTIGERIALQVAPDGTLGVLFNVTQDGSGTVVDDLVYCSSTDGGVNWSPQCDNIDKAANLHVGGQPSLTYDSQSRPVVSYYLCGGSSDCPQQEDGLRLAIRDDTNQWRVYNVHNDASSRSGLYSQIVLDPVTDQPTLVFHNVTRGSAVVAQGAFN